MRLKPYLIAAALLTAACLPTSANIIEVVFTGLATGIRPTIDASGLNYDLGSFSGRPFTADFVFNTDKGTLQTISPGSYRLDGGLVNAFIDLGNLGIWGGSGGYFGTDGGRSFLTWQDDLSFVTANAGGEHYHLWMYTPGDPASAVPRYGGFQFGNCPTVLFGPCGYATSAVITSFVSAPVPGPIVGAGLPGLLIVVVLLCRALYRWRMS